MNQLLSFPDKVAVSSSTRRWNFRAGAGQNNNVNNGASESEDQQQKDKLYRKYKQSLMSLMIAPEQIRQHQQLREALCQEGKLELVDEDQRLVSLIQRTQQLLPVEANIYPSLPIISAAEAIGNAVRTKDHAKHTNTDAKRVTGWRVHQANNGVARVADSSVVSYLRQHEQQKRTQSLHQMSVKNVVDHITKPEVADKEAEKGENQKAEEAVDDEYNQSFGFSWLRNFNDVIQFKNRYGKFDVSDVSLTGDDIRLATWMKSQREQYQKFMRGEQSELTEVRIAAMEAIGFNWSISLAWDDMYQRFCSHKERYGSDWRQNLEKCSKSSRLGIWLCHQRHEYNLHQEGKKTRLESYQIRLLDDIDSDWNIQSSKKRKKSTTNALEYDELMASIDTAVKQAEAEAKATVDGGSKLWTRTRTTTTMDNMQFLVLDSGQGENNFQRDTDKLMARNEKQKERTDQDEDSPKTPTSGNADASLPRTVVVSSKSVVSTPQSSSVIVSDSNKTSFTTALSSANTTFEPDCNSDDKSNRKRERNFPCDEVTGDGDGYESDDSCGDLVF